MIPRLRPYLGREELLAVFSAADGAVARFERAFASQFEASYAVAFPYGRSGLWALLKALGVEGAEVIMPAYTCSVVAHATVLSGNIPRFVDVSLHDYNMSLDEVEASINAKTRAVIATHLFGYPLDVDRLRGIVETAEALVGHKIWLIQDCAHAFGARWRGRLVASEGDAALFGLNVSKTITSVFGGMITTNDPDVHQRLRAVREREFRLPPAGKAMRRALYLAAVYPAFDERVYPLVHWVQAHMSLLDRFTKAYHRDERIHFPPDALDLMIDLEARVGLVQLRKYDAIVRFRRAAAAHYDRELRDVPGLRLPPLVEGATYSHYPVLAKDRPRWLDGARRAGIELGQVIEYSIPDTPPYLPYRLREFPNSSVAATGMLNLPVHVHVGEPGLRRVVAALRKSVAPTRCP